MKNNTVIIIDVKKTKATVLSGLLSDLGYSVLGDFESGADTGTRCLRERPGTVIMGITPQGNPAGEEIIKSLRSHYFPLVIYCSEEYIPGISEKMPSFQGYLVPPFTRSQLAAILDSAKNSESARETALAMERFRVSFMNNPDYCYIISPEGIILDINNSALDALGFAREDLVGRPLKNIYHPDSLDRMDYLFQQWKSTGEINNEKISIITRDGRKIKVILSVSSVRDRDGTLLHSISYQHDITEFENVFEAFRESERKYRTIFEHAPMGIFHVNTSGEFLAMNGRMARILGFDSPEEVIEKIDYIGVEEYADPIRDREFLRLLTEKGLAENFEFPAQKKDGSSIVISVNAGISTYNEDGSYDIIGFTEDVTRRREAESLVAMGNRHILLISELTTDLNNNATIDEIIKKTCDRLKEIHDLRFADFYFKVISPDFNEYLVNQYSNIQSTILDAIEKLTGLSLKKIRIPLFQGSIYKVLYSGRIPMEFNGKDEVARVIRDFVLPEKKILRAMAGEVSRIAGSRYVYLVPLMVRNEPIAHIGFNRDSAFSGDEKEAINLIMDKVSSIFERVRTDEALRSSLREKEILLKEIHHRVKNNMQVISSLLNLQSGYINDEGDRELFNDSQNRIRSMSLIHEQLYQSSSLSQIDFKSYTAKLINEVLLTYNTDSKILVETDVLELPLSINVAIPCALILNELLSNALKHAFPGNREGIIRVSFIKKDDDSYSFTVSDNGIGLEESLDPYIVKSLGMHLVTELTRQIGGTLEILRKGGTAFIITFKDLYETPPIEKFQCIEPMKDSEKMVLIVEDDLITGNFLKKMLEKRGYRVPPVMITGESAVDFVRRCRPDLVIMDILLGGAMDGIETARLIKDQYSVPVIFSSGNSEDATLARVQKIRPAGFILKPIDTERLIALVNQVLGG